MMALKFYKAKLEIAHVGFFCNIGGVVASDLLQSIYGPLYI